jgi:hypothetical protein
LKRKIAGIGIALIACAGIYFSIEFYDRYKQPQRVAWMLNIKAPPASLRVTDCKSGPWTDVVITCAAEISPADFPLLLAGYKYEMESTSGFSHDFWGEVGTPFTVNAKYQAEPASFKHGGSVTVLADEAKKNVLIDLYME